MEKNKGFTLVEMILAIAILSIIATGMLNAFVQSELVTTKSKKMMASSYDCQTYMEKIQYEGKGKTYQEIRNILKATPFSFTENLVTANVKYTYSKTVSGKKTVVTLDQPVSLNGLVSIVVSQYQPVTATTAQATIESYLTVKTP